MNRVDFIVRDNSDTKSGGDLIQIQQYADHLKRHDWDARIVPFSPRLELRTGAIVHIVNVDRPFDAISAAHQARGHRIFVSSIHHSLPAIRRMRRGESGLGVRSLLGRVLSDSAREYISFLVRGLRHANSVGASIAAVVEGVRLFHAVGDAWATVGRMLDRVDGVFILAAGEGQDLQSDTGWHGHNAILAPNGVPTPEPVVTTWEDRAVPVLIVGRVEPRKRQLEIVRAAAGRDIQIEVIGALHQPESAFGRAFTTAVSNAPNVTWVGALSHAETVARMNDAKMLVNASWVEVQSLVELEAALMGAWVVGSSRAGNSAEHLGPIYRGVDGDDIEAMLDEAQRILREDEAPQRLDYAWTWDRSSAVIAAQYGAAGGAATTELA